MVRVAINGFGRIGRILLKLLLENNVNVIAVNSTSDVKNKVHLLKYDSVYGKYDQPISIGKDYFTVAGKKILSLMERDPIKLPWARLGIDIVIESTGLFEDREHAALHLKAGAKRVIISAPSVQSDKTFCYGVNHKEFDPKKHFVVSTASCTTNCLAPMAKVLNDAFGIEKGLMTTVHALTSTQNLLDNSLKDLRRARSAFNIIPTTTGATIATVQILPELKGKIDGFSLRVPVADVSILDFTVVLKKSVTKEEINSAFVQASRKELKGVLDVIDEPLVSSDFIKDPHACIIDSLSTVVLKGNFAKVVGWYDNEYGYAVQLVKTLKYIAEKM